MATQQPREPYIHRLLAAVDQKKSHVCVGLDPRLDSIPKQIAKEKLERFNDPFQAVAEVFLEFGQRIIDAVAPHAVAIKPQIAFYEQYGHFGLKAFEDTVRYAKQLGLLVIGDAKRNDIGPTAEAYSAAYLGKVELLGGRRQPSYDLDAITVNPYLGSDGILPFVTDAMENGKGIFILVKTSNASSRELQDLRLSNSRVVYEEIAHLVDAWGEGTESKRGYKVVGAVVGATFPEQANVLRGMMPKSYFLVPGYGKQGATAKDAAVCFNADGYGAVVNSARNIIFAYESSPWKEQFSGEHFDRAAEAAVIAMKEELNRELKSLGRSAW